LAVGAIPDRRLHESLIGTGIPVHVVGDCYKVGDAMRAIHEGFVIGNSI
jgi:hypothetical protein